MKKILCIFLSLLMLLPTFAYAEGEVATYSETYVVMERYTGKVLASKGMDIALYPASITKILTTALALEKAKNNLDQDYTVARIPVLQSNLSGTTHIALKPGEIVSLRSLVYTTMVESANDSANCLADYYMDGDFYNFPSVMNKKCEELGCKTTNFTNANGLPDAYHYTTAYDMALITKYALDVPGFMEAFCARSYTMPADNVKETPYPVSTHNEFIKPTSQYYNEWVKGGKLGWTEEANHTMVILAEKDGLELIIVVMDSLYASLKFSDCNELMSYCFTNYSASDFPKPVNNEKNEEIVENIATEETEKDIEEIETKEIIQEDELLLPDIPNIEIKENNSTLIKIKAIVIWTIAGLIILYMIFWILRQRKRRLIRNQKIARRMASLKSNTERFR